VHRSSNGQTSLESHHRIDADSTLTLIPCPLHFFQGSPSARPTFDLIEVKKWKSSEHLDLTSLSCRPPPLPHPLFPCKGLATDRSRRFSLTSPLFFCSQPWAPEHMLLPTYQYPLSLAVQCTPVSPLLGSIYFHYPFKPVLLIFDYLASSCHPTPLYLNLRGAPLKVCSPRRLIEDSRAPSSVNENSAEQ
jgi:hypothetical protein